MREPDGYPGKQGLYDPRYEHDACGIGFVASIAGRKSHQILRQALTVLANLAHRGGVGSEPDSGDGAGIILQIPHAFLAEAAPELHLPAPGEYAVGTIFLPRDPLVRDRCEETFRRIAEEEGQKILGWRTVPTDASSIGETARRSQPCIRQVFLRRGAGLQNGSAFERKLYLLRRRVEAALQDAGREGGGPFYAASLSSRTVVYKGMLTARQVAAFYPDLADPRLETALALVHSRYSTNTFPSWERAHPYRYLAHNGEINTLRGNINWMRARQSMLQSEIFGEDLAKVLPLIDSEGSDSAAFDNCLEFLALTGRSLPHAVMMMIPEPWENHETMSDEKKAFYAYHSCLMEPWDGPAAIAFTDGRLVGAVLDRNGLRPSRYCLTKDGLAVMASEAGVIDLPPERILRKGRLEPGRMLLVDTEEGRVIADEEIKRTVAAEHPYQSWLDQYEIALADLPEGTPPPALSPAAILRAQMAFGYTWEDQRLILGPMGQDGVEPVGAMGNDTPLAVLSDRPQLLYDYFKQLFAQVTNPPIDSIREEIVTSTQVLLGAEGRLLDPGPEACRQIRARTPILTDGELARLRGIDRPGFKAATLPILFRAAAGGTGMAEALDSLFGAADQAILDGCNLLILSDRSHDRENAPIPALLAVAGLHHHLIRAGTRTRVSLILESGEPREVHHFALLLGYGVSAVDPYLAYASLAESIRQGLLPNVAPERAVAGYIKAVTKGVQKILSKMGISTFQGYQGAQIFEALGLSQSVIDRYFTWTPSRIGGIGLEIIAREAVLRHTAAYRETPEAGEALPSGGAYQWRRDGEYHLYNPETIHKLQTACRNGDYGLYREYTGLINEQSQRPCTLRGLLDFKPAGAPVPLAEVEPVEAICKRFKTGAMSFGSISREAHETLAIAMNRLGGKSNSGEGGEDPARYIRDENGDSRCSAIKQVASGRFGVTLEYLASARELQIKIAQGAKPGEGGQLPGRKVYPWIARVRHSTPGVGLISPPPHHDIYSIEDLAELIHDLKNANPAARIGVKLVSEVGVGTVAAGVAKGRADVILISGYDGGTGASPRSSIRHAGLPWELGLAETNQTLLLNGLRGRVALEVDGKLMTGRDVAVAALLGAEEFGFATAPLVVLGCVMMRLCNLDTCPVGVATQHPELRKRFAGRPEHVVNFMRFVAQEVREIMAQLGFRTMEEMIGRTDVLAQTASRHWKAGTLDLSGILHQPEIAPEAGRLPHTLQDHGLEASLDRRVLLDICRPALLADRPVRAILPIDNTNRVVGTQLGAEVIRSHGPQGLPADTIRLHFRGTAGQSFGAFIPPGLTLILEGDANDYLGKGLSGGKIIVFPPEGSTFQAEENVILGNVAFYGATSGEAYIRGVAGERFCVRNSGLDAVVEGIGEHGCEYMTGGRVVVLGRTGRNFAAGMSGGVAYVLDERGDFPRQCNRDLVELESLADEGEAEQVREMIRRHAEHTGSDAAKKVLARWRKTAGLFVKVIPRDYQRALAALQRVSEAGLSGEAATMAAFEENKGDLARVSGN